MRWRLFEEFVRLTGAARRRRHAARPGAALRRAAADPAQLLEPDQGPLAPDRRAAGAAVRASAATSRRGWMDVPHDRRRGHAERCAAPTRRSRAVRRRRATRRRRRTTTSASSSASCSPTTGATRSAPARACSTCWARC
ncbi:MAG: hypothetical protein MZW92_55855 [Comamonadaceae bacterium]|nr:hypothetical protein [Comamonadaceae bacterium]